MPKQNSLEMSGDFVSADFEPCSFGDFWKVKDWKSPMWSDSLRRPKELAWKLSFLTNMSVQERLMGSTGTFALWQTYKLWLCGIFWEMILMQFLVLLSFVSCSLGLKEVAQSGHLHLLVVTNVHLLCLKMQDTDQLLPGGLAQWDCCLGMARNLLIPSRLWKSPKY